jgi:hypothetical protein
MTLHMNRPGLLCAALLLAGAATAGDALAATTRAASELKVSVDFPGGAADVARIDQEGRRIRFEIPTKAGWRAWWSLKVSGIVPGETIRLELAGRTQASAARAVYSTDGQTWRYTSAHSEKPAAGGTLYVQKIDAAEAHFAWYVPFVLADAQACVDRAARALAGARPFELCKSEDGLPVVGVRIAEPGGDEASRYGVWIHARQHAWEVGGSWTAAGLIDWLVGDDPRAKALRSKATITVLPIIDVDNVQKGAGGKDQKPHDHNRDWLDKPRWKAVQAAMGELAKMKDAGRLDFFLDLHDPGWSGPGLDFWCHGVSQLPAHKKRNAEAFMAALKADVLDPWKAVGPTSKYALTTPTSGLWVRAHSHDWTVSGTIEVAVAPPRGFADPPPAHHLLAGKYIGLAIERHLRADVRKP